MVYTYRPIYKTTLRIGYFQFFVRTDHIMRLSFLFEQLVILPDMGPLYPPLLYQSNVGHMYTEWSFYMR